MSTDQPDAAVPQVAPQGPQPALPACGCCCGRTRLYAILLLILAVAVGGGWIVFQQTGGALRSTAQYQAAMQKIRANETLRDALGAPITDSWQTGGQPEAMQFEVYGPKGSAKVHVDARKLEATLEPSGKRVLVPLGKEKEAPAFHGNQPPPAAKPSPAGPSPEIKIDLPPPPK